MSKLSSRLVKETARRIGFSACGLAHPEPLPAWREAEWRRFLLEGHHAEMNYLEKNLEKRLNPCLLLDGARTMVCVALNYAHSLAPLRDETPDENEENEWKLARYAYGDDYHDVMKQKLRLFLHELGIEEGAEARVFADTAPIDEKFWAMRAGLCAI